MLGAKLNGSMLRASTDDNYIELGWYERLSWMRGRTMPMAEVTMSEVTQRKSEVAM